MVASYLVKYAQNIAVTNSAYENNEVLVSSVWNTKIISILNKC
jgi:hypothetical protein